MKVLMRDDTAPHQIRIWWPKNYSLIAVSCNCQPPGVYLDARPVLPAATALAAYRAHLAQIEGAA